MRWNGLGWWFGGVLLGLTALPAAQAAAVDPAEALRAELRAQTTHEFRMVQTGATIVVSDAPDELAVVCARHLDTVLPKLRALARFPADAPAPDTVRVALFAKPADFEQFLRARKAPPAQSFICVDLDQPARRAVAAFILDRRPLLARLRHVAFDLLLHAWIAHPPPWLAEGLAECAEDAVFPEPGSAVNGPPRGHLRDLREKVLEVRPSPALPLKDLVRMDRQAWDRAGLAAYAESWGFVRFLLEDPARREARFVQKLFASLSPTATEEENLRRSQAIFLDDEWDAHEADWRAFLGKLPETPAEAPYRRAREVLTQGKFDAAQALLNQAAKVDPDYERLYYFRAVAAFSQDQWAAAAADLDQALALFPEYHAARFLRARCRAALKDLPGARADFTACLLTPYHDRAKQALAGLTK